MRRPRIAVLAALALVALIVYAPAADALTLKEGLGQAYRLQVRNVNQQLGFDTMAMELLSASTAPSADQ